MTTGPRIFGILEATLGRKNKKGTKMTIKNISRIFYGRDNGDGHCGRYRRLFTMPGSVLLAGAICLSPALVSQASASPLPAPAQGGDYSGPGDGCAEGTWTSQNDVLCQSFLARKDVCKAWEGQANVEWGQKFDACRLLP
jgi:hypothetical protein